MSTIFHRLYAPIRWLMPSWISVPIRCVATAFLTPLVFSLRSGHFRSSLWRAAVTRKGQPLPWYTYPTIDFLRCRDFTDRTVLEFGGGQSTFWWASRARRVVTFEDNAAWLERLRRRIPDNVALRLVSAADAEACIADVRAGLAEVGESRFDVVVIDGLFRRELVAIACELVAPDGIIICDNAEGYGFHAELLGRGLNRIDFYGYAPGVIQPHCTSICHGDRPAVLDAAIPIRKLTPP